MTNPNRMRSIIFNTHQRLIYLAKQQQLSNNVINYCTVLKSKIAAMLNLKEFQIEVLKARVLLLRLKSNNQWK